MGRVEELLAGRFPGVLVLPTPSGGWMLRIRSSALDRAPLYVVDGLPVEVTPDRGLDWLEPSDDERIDILREPAETSMFGGRGANGVVLIKTKSHRNHYQYWARIHNLQQRTSEATLAAAANRWKSR